MILSIISCYRYDETLFDNAVFPSGVDKQKCIDNILLKCAELELLYSEIDTLKIAIDIWSRKNIENWNKLFTALSAEYSPIENYNRIEEFGNHSTVNSNVQQNRAVFDSDELVETGKDTNIAKNESGGESHIHGNIGVTTNQQMIEEELKLRNRYNIYDIIADSFKKDFCLMVY